MRINATPQARSFIRAHGGMLFVWVTGRGATRVLRTSTEPPPDALDWHRIETKGFLVFVPPWMRRPRELLLEERGWIRRRVRAFWDGCAYVV